MKNILLLTALLSSPLMSYAEESAYPVTQPFTTTHSLKIVSEKELKVLKELQQQPLKTQQEMKQKGYHETNNRYAQFLLDLKRNAIDEIRAYRGTQNVADTHLKQNLQDIKLAFEFKALPIDNKEAIIGYAPIGSYVKSPKEGWNGIKIFFENKDLGMCAYEFTDLNLSNGGVMLTKEYTKYIVNNKPTFISVEGNDNSGFVYTVTWYNSIKVSTMDCATKIFQKGLTDKMLKLAKKIDSKIF